MPTYQYCCQSCGNELEVFHKINEPLKQCPKCKKETLEQQFSGGQTLQVHGKKPSGKTGGCCPCGHNKGSCH